VTILSELRGFLGSVKNSESITRDLRDRITVVTGLEVALASAIRENRNVIIAGSAGGGKTHLLGTFAEGSGTDLPRFVTWPSEQEPADGPFVRVITDATAVPADSRQKMLEDRPQNCRAVAIAINEGPLLGLAHEFKGSAYDAAVDILHAAQRGIRLPPDASKPVVLDVGGYDPIENNVIAQLLALPVLDELVQSQTCSCATPEVCYRRRAWALLRSEVVRKRTNDLLRVVNMLGQPVLFRELWDFIADIILGGTCLENPPTSPWFWRVFYGSSLLSKRLRAVADPSLVIYPRTESHIWYGDWDSSELDLEEGLQLIRLNSAVPMTTEIYRWLKSQIFFLIRSASTAQVLRDLVDLELTRAIQEKNVLHIVAAINQYMSYGTLHPSQTDLQLWIDLGVEKRTERKRGEVSLGTVPAAELRLQQSLAVANHPDPQCQVYGARHFLVHSKGGVDTGASFSLSPEVLNLLRGGRSYRTSDRPHTDMEWHLSRFFASLSAASDRRDQLDVMEIDFKSMSGNVGSYRIATALCRIEPLGRM
jgi:hypothetical protein